jgi:hypothetical protein
VYIFEKHNNMETVEYKFKPKSKVYYLKTESKPIFKKCPYCLGEGHFKRIDDTLIDCPYCSGRKEITNGGSIIEVPKKTKILTVDITIDEDDIDIIYNLKDGYSLREFQLFETEEEAEKSKKPNHAMGYTS